MKKSKKKIETKQEMEAAFSRIKRLLAQSEKAEAQQMELFGKMLAKLPMVSLPIARVVGYDAAYVITQLFAKMEKNRQAESCLPRIKRKYFHDSVWCVEVPKGKGEGSDPDIKWTREFRSLLKSALDGFYVRVVPPDDGPRRRLVTVDIGALVEAIQENAS